MARTNTNRMMQIGTMALAMVAGTQMALAQCGAIKMIAASPSASARLGNAMAYQDISGSPRILVGASRFDQAPYFGVGRVYLMGQISNQWGEVISVSDPNPFNSNFFGHSVGMSDPYIIVGAPGTLTNRGAAYIYERQANTYVLRGTVSSSEPMQRVGEAVAIDGDYAVIGAPNTDVGANTDAGLVSIFKRNGMSWAQNHTILNNNLTGLNTNNRLGMAVAIEGTLVVAGAPEGTWVPNPTQHGYIQAIRRAGDGTWAVEGQAYIIPTGARSNMNFGASIATDGTKIVVGAPGYTYSTSSGDEVNASSAGAVYVMALSGNTWVVESMIKAPEPEASGRFGSSVAFNGSVIMVGASGSKTAYAYRLTGGNWVLDRAYSDEDTSASGTFGSSVAIGGGRVFIGDSEDDHSTETNPGAVYIKNLPSGYSDSCEGAIVVQSGNAGGCTLEATVDGASACGNGPSGIGPDVWYSWTPRCSGNVIIDTFGSGYDTVLSVHSACPGAGNTNTIVCNDDGFSSPSRDSLVTFNYTAGTTYLIRVAGYNGAAGNFTLRVNEYLTPGNDNCSSADAAFNGANAFKTCKATTDGPTDDAQGQNDEDIRQDVWFNYTATSTGSIVVNTCGSNFDTILQVFPAAACPMSNAEAIATNDDAGVGCPGGTLNSRLSFNATSGVVYKVRVGGFSGLGGTATGEGNVNIAPVCPCDFNGGGLNVSDIFDFLNAWFGGSAAADVNGGGLSPQDIFDFLNCWFAGCN